MTRKSQTSNVNARNRNTAAQNTNNNAARPSNEDRQLIICRPLEVLDRMRIEVCDLRRQKDGANIDFGDDLTQAHAARLFVHLFGPRLRHCAELGWLEYRHDHGYWKRVPCARVLRLTRTLAGAYKRAAVSCEHESRNRQSAEERKALTHRAEALRKAALRVSGKSTQDGIITLAAAQLSIRPEQLDAKPLLVNLKNGVLNLRTGKVSAHKAKHYFSKVANVSYKRILLKNSLLARRLLCR